MKYLFRRLKANFQFDIMLLVVTLWGLFTGRGFQEFRDLWAERKDYIDLYMAIVDMDGLVEKLSKKD